MAFDTRLAFDLAKERRLLPTCMSSMSSTVYDIYSLQNTAPSSFNLLHYTFYFIVDAFTFYFALCFLNNLVLVLRIEFSECGILPSQPVFYNVFLKTCV